MATDSDSETGLAPEREEASILRGPSRFDLMVSLFLAKRESRERRVEFVIKLAHGGLPNSVKAVIDGVTFTNSQHDPNAVWLTGVIVGRGTFQGRYCLEMRVGEITIASLGENYV